MLAIWRGRLICSAALMLGVAAQAAAQEPPRTGGPPVNPRAALMKAFVDRVHAYVELQKKAEEGIPDLSGDENPSMIEAHQAAMAARMKILRPGAKRGDLFGDADAIFREALRQDAAARRQRGVKAAAEEVPKYEPPRVNVAYPETQPLATVPPLLLSQFPRLPEGMEYRFLGNDLILRDTKANLVADFINETVPSPTR
jgi:hypothetical protein